jgi:hypothetical protein
MKKIVLTFGLISGGILSAMMLATIPFIDRIGFDHGAVIGYTTMVLAFLLVYFGVRSYREHQGGTVTFGKAFQVGLGITLIACICYVVTWEFIHTNFFPDFLEKYSAYAIANLKASGASPEAVQKMTADLAKYQEWYKNPVYKALLTLMEPLPVGLLFTFISAFALKTKTKKAA